MRLLALLAATVLLGASLAAPVPKEKAKDDHEVILGTWQAIKRDAGAEIPSPPAEELAKHCMTFSKDGTVEINYLNGQKRNLTYKLDPTAKLKQFDLEMDGSKSLGVYVLDGDTLTLACASRDYGRPADGGQWGRGDDPEAGDKREE